jgi:hypothetical protein
LLFVSYDEETEPVQSQRDGKRKRREGGRERKRAEGIENAAQVGQKKRCEWSGFGAESGGWAK